MHGKSIEPPDLINHTEKITALAWSPDATQIASGTRDRGVYIWNARTGELLHTLNKHKKAITSLAWSPDATRIASGGRDGVVYIWNARTGQVLYTLAHPKAITDLNWPPDGENLFSVAQDNSIRIWRHYDLYDPYENGRDREQIDWNSYRTKGYRLK